MYDRVLSWLNSPALTAFGAPTSWAEALGFAAGAACVYLVAKQHIANWPLGIANNVLWIVLFMSAGLFADLGLQVVYIVLGLWGWWQWQHVGSRRVERQVSGTSPREWAYLVVAGAVTTGALTWFLASFTSSTVPFWDAVTTTLSLMATYGQAMKRWESWWLWMAADVIYVPLYLYKGLDLTALLSLVLFALCVKGLVEWRRELRTGSVARVVDQSADTELAALDVGGLR